MNKLLKIDKDYSHSKLSQDLMVEFPDIKGFSERNIKYIRQWFLFYRPQKATGQQPAALLEKTIGQKPAERIQVIAAEYRRD